MIFIIGLTLAFLLMLYWHRNETEHHSFQLDKLEADRMFAYTIMFTLQDGGVRKYHETFQARYISDTVYTGGKLANRELEAIAARGYITDDSGVSYPFNKVDRIWIVKKRVPNDSV